MSIITTLIVSIGERKEKFFIRPTEMAKYSTVISASCLRK